MKISDVKILICRHDMKWMTILIVNRKCFLSEYISGENHNIITKEIRQ